MEKEAKEGGRDEGEEGGTHVTFQRPPLTCLASLRSRDRPSYYRIINSTGCLVAFLGNITRWLATVA